MFPPLKVPAPSVCPPARCFLGPFVFVCSVALQVSKPGQCFGACSDSSSLVWIPQATDAEFPAPLPDGTAHHPGGGQLFPYADLHDLQWLPLHRRGSRRRDRLLPVQLEEGDRGGHHRALSLTTGSRPEHLPPCSWEGQWSAPKHRGSHAKKSHGLLPYQLCGPDDPMPLTFPSYPHLVHFSSEEWVPGR